jgi:hypothetical protein
MADTEYTRERTPQDYAIEHAGYMVDAAKHLLEKINAEDSARMRHDETGTRRDARALDAAMDLRGEAIGRLRSAIYEFEKRRDRAAASPASKSAGVTACWGLSSFCAEVGHKCRATGTCVYAPPPPDGPLDTSPDQQKGGSGVTANEKLRAAAALAIKALDEEAAAYAPDRLAHVDEAAAALRAALSADQQEQSRGGEQG